MNTLIETHDSEANGLRAQVWLTISGKWMVTYMDLDSRAQLGCFTICESLKQASQKAHEFAFGRIGQTSIAV